MVNKIKWGMLSLLSLGLMTSCINNSDWDVPELTCNNKYDAPTMSLKDFVALAPTSGTVTITEDIIIDGYVISSDEQGNFYRTISFQDSPTNPTTGLQIEVQSTNNYANYPIGTHIRINAKGLVLGVDRGMIKLGATDPNYAIGRISEIQVPNHISVVCENGKPDVETIKPKELNTLNMAKSDQYRNILVSVPNVQFADSEVLGTVKVYAEEVNGKISTTTRAMVDNTGATANLATSSVAKFASESLPTGNGKITFVVSKYNSDYQMIIRSVTDVEFVGERKTSASTTTTGVVKGGTGISYAIAGFTEDFESYATGESSEAFPKYYNAPIVGNRYWRVATYAQNKYIQMNLGTGTTTETKTYFVVPVDFDQMNTLSFKTKDGYYKGDVLKVYYSTDYQPNSQTATLTDITSSFQISKGSTKFATNFTDSGNWSKPSTLTGKGYIIFEFHGGGSLPTTAMQIDDITIQ